jgi:hypothetical protein
MLQDRVAQARAKKHLTQEQLVAAGVWLAELDTKRMMWGWCTAYREDGRVCPAPATIVDRQGGGLICVAYAPAASLSTSGRPS